jgi:hypothetical protein
MDFPLSNLVVSGFIVYNLPNFMDSEEIYSRLVDRNGSKISQSGIEAQIKGSTGWEQRWVGRQDRHWKPIKSTENYMAIRKLLVQFYSAESNFKEIVAIED